MVGLFLFPFSFVFFKHCPSCLTPVKEIRVPIVSIKDIGTVKVPQIFEHADIFESNVSISFINQADGLLILITLFSKENEIKKKQSYFSQFEVNIIFN